MDLLVADAQAATAGAQQVGVQFAALDFAVDEGAADAQPRGDLVGGMEGHAADAFKTTSVRRSTYTSFPVRSSAM